MKHPRHQGRNVVLEVVVEIKGLEIVIKIKTLLLNDVLMEHVEIKGLENATLNE
jgi:hypothetical protein